MRAGRARRVGQVNAGGRPCRCGKLQQVDGFRCTQTLPPAASRRPSCTTKTLPAALLIIEFPLARKWKDAKRDVAGLFCARQPLLERARFGARLVAARSVRPRRRSSEAAPARTRQTMALHCSDRHSLLLPLGSPDGIKRNVAENLPAATRINEQTLTCTKAGAHCTAPPVRLETGQLRAIGSEIVARLERPRRLEVWIRWANGLEQAGGDLLPRARPLLSPGYGPWRRHCRIGHKINLPALLLLTQSCSFISSAPATRRVAAPTRRLQAGSAAAARAADSSGPREPLT